MTAEIVITGAEGAFASLPDRLGGLAVRVAARPLLSFAEPETWAPVDEAIVHLGRYTCAVATSPRGGQAFVERIGYLRRARRVTPLPDIEVWASGRTTAATLAPVFGDVRLPDPALVRRIGASAAIARTMLAEGVGGPVLYVCGATRRDEIVDLLRGVGIEIVEVLCYRSVLADLSVAREAAASADVLVVSSPSVAELLARACPDGLRPPLLAIGPTTAHAATEAGWAPAAIADRPDVDALAAGIRTLLTAR